MRHCQVNLRYFLDFFYAILGAPNRCYPRGSVDKPSTNAPMLGTPNTDLGSLGLPQTSAPAREYGT